MEARKQGKGMKGVVSWLIACLVFFVGFTLIQGHTPGAVDAVGIGPLLIIIVLDGAVMTIWNEIAGPRKEEAKPQ